MRQPTSRRTAPRRATTSTCVASIVHPTPTSGSQRGGDDRKALMIEEEWWVVWAIYETYNHVFGGSHLTSQCRVCGTERQARELADRWRPKGSRDLRFVIAPWQD